MQRGVSIPELLFPRTLRQPRPYLRKKTLSHLIQEPLYLQTRLLLKRITHGRYQLLLQISSSQIASP